MSKCLIRKLGFLEAWRSCCVVGLLGMNTALLPDILAQEGAIESEVNGLDKSKSAFDEIIVSAEKRDENLQDLSQAVSVLTGETLNARAVRSFVDLSALAPGVTVTSNANFRPSVSIRGLGNEGNQNDIVNPSVSYHIDGVYIASQFSLKTDFLDVEQVEVLRGPQGTLFGQNSIGGAINVTTSAPDFDEYAASADFAYGSFNHINVRAAVNIPLASNLAVRGSINFLNQEGSATNISTNSNIDNLDQFVNVAGFDLISDIGNVSPIGQDLDDSNNLSWRARLLWAPIENFTLNLSAQQFHEDTNGSAQFGLNDPTPLRGPEGRRQLSQDSPSAFELASQVYSLVAKWELPSLSIKYLGSFQRDEIQTSFDNDRINGAFVSSFVVQQDQVSESFVSELNLVSNEPLFGKLDWVIGGFYLNQDIEANLLELLDLVGENGNPAGFPDGEFDPFDTSDPTFLLGFAPAGTDLGFQTAAFPSRESLSFYAQGTVKLTPALNAIGGVRYTDDNVDSSTFNFFTLPNGVAPVSVGQSDQALSGRVALEYKTSLGQLVYGSYTRGFKPGGSNFTFGLEGDAAPALVQPSFGPETVNAFEIGIKGDYFDNRIRANLASFYYDYNNLQFQATDPNVFQGGIDTIEASEIYGVEAELQIVMTDHVRFDANIAYVETQITNPFLALDNVAADNATNALLAQGAFLFGPEIEAARFAAVTNVEGNDLAKTPRLSHSASLNYDRQLSHGRIFASLQWIRRGEFQQRIFNNLERDQVASYNQINLLASYDHVKTGVGIEFAIQNLTNSDGINSRFTDVFGVGSTSDQLIAPRQFIGRVKYRF